jgi:glucosylceramidase
MKYFGSPWSSPAWMKTTGTFNHGGVLIGEPGGKYYQIWANYFVKYVKHLIL